MDGSARNIPRRAGRSHFPGRASSRPGQLPNGFAEEQASDGAELEIDIDQSFHHGPIGKRKRAPGQMGGGKIAHLRLVPRSFIRFGSGRTIIQEMKQKAEPVSPDGSGSSGGLCG